MISAKSVVGMLLPASFRSKLRERYVSMNVNHIHGPRMLQLSKNQAAVTCVLKNGGYYIDSFIQHYLQMGFRHIFFLDNGSSDETIAIAKQYDNVSVCQSTLPINTNQRLFKKYLAESSIRGGWCLDADIDEFFDYPLSDTVNLRQFIEYLNQNCYTAVVTHLLDMFADRPLSHLSKEEKEDVKAIYQYYDVTDVVQTGYLSSEIVAKYASANRLADSEMMLYWGGVRKTLYGNNCLLTKHSLFSCDSGVSLFPHVHFVNKADVADVSCVMLHYKLTSNAMAVARQNQSNFTQNSGSYGAFISELERESHRNLKQGTAKQFINATDLARSKFLTMSCVYEQYALARNAARVPVPIQTGGRNEWPASGV